MFLFHKYKSFKNKDILFILKYDKQHSSIAVLKKFDLKMKNKKDLKTRKPPSLKDNGFL